jgi:hypothetical protein
LIRKLILQRILLLCLLYCAVFVIISIIQFSGQETPIDEPITPEEKNFNLGDFIIPQAQSKSDFDVAISRWRDENFQLWSRLVLTGNDEDLVISSIEEAINRSAYRTAISAIPAAFLNGNRRTHISSVYLGRLDQASSSLTAADRDKYNRISQFIQEKSPELLNESRCFEFLFIRRYSNIEEGVDLIRSIDPETIELVHIPGIFQGYYDWNNFFPDRENPFAHLVEKACAILSGSLWMNPERTGVLAANGDRIDTEFNIRLGKALLGWAESVGTESWAALAKSIILSVLSLGNNGSISAEFSVLSEGEISESPAAARLSTARLYLVLYEGTYRPRAVALGPQAENAWAWTASGNIITSMQNSILDIRVNFPAGETHYMIIRGLRPFTKLQFYDFDWSSTPQYENSDSSGWNYIASEQTLFIKMRHRTADEHIRIYY